MPFRIDLILVFHAFPARYPGGECYTYPRMEAEMREGQERQRGKFRQMMIRQLAFMAVIFSLIVLIVLFFLFQLLYGYSEGQKENAFQSQLSIVDIAYTVFSDLPSQLPLAVIDGYSSAVSLGEVGKAQLYARSIYDSIRLMIARSPSKMAFSIAVIENMNMTVISDKGSCSLDYFIQSESGVPSAMQIQLRDDLEQGEAGIFPVYQEDGMLSEFSLVIPVSEVISMYLRIYVSSFFSIVPGEHAFLLIPGFGEISYLEADIGEVPVREESISEQLSGMAGEYRVYFDDDMILYVLCLSFIIVAILLFVFSAAMIMHNIRRLYHPLAVAITPEGESTPHDEIAAVAGNRKMVTSLRQEVAALMKEHDETESVRRLRFLLDDEPSPGIEMDIASEFTVAMIYLGDSDSYADSLIHFRLCLEEAIGENQISVLVPYGFDRYVLVMKCSYEKAFGSVKDIMRLLNEESEAGAVISDAVIGEQNLHFACRQCQMLLDRFSDLRTHRILSSGDIKELNSLSFDYPVSDEMRLIRMTVTAMPDSGRFFSDLLERNLSNDAARTDRIGFCHAMLGTLSRIGDELCMDDRESSLLSQLYFMTDPLLLEGHIRTLYAAMLGKAKKKVDVSDSVLISEMKEYIHMNYMKDIGLPDLSERFNITPKYCGRLFAQLSNENFRNYLNGYRIEQAKKIMEANPEIRIGDLAGMVGFNSANSFIRVFDKFVGISPGVFSQEVRAKKSEIHPNSD